MGCSGFCAMHAEKTHLYHLHQCLNPLAGLQGPVLHSLCCFLRVPKDTFLSKIFPTCLQVAGLRVLHFAGTTKSSSGFQRSQEVPEWLLHSLRAHRMLQKWAGWLEELWCLSESRTQTKMVSTSSSKLSCRHRQSWNCSAHACAEQMEHKITSFPKFPRVLGCRFEPVRSAVPSKGCCTGLHRHRLCPQHVGLSTNPGMARITTNLQGLL